MHTNHDRQDKTEGRSVANEAAGRGGMQRVPPGGISVTPPVRQLQKTPVIQMKPPTDPHVFTYEDSEGLVWSRDLETDKWYRPGPRGEKIFRGKSDDAKEDHFAEAGSAIGYFKNPASIWGKKDGDLRAELLEQDFVESRYQGSSEAYEFIKNIPGGGVISIVVNYGGGRHSHSLGKAKFEPAFYYKLEWNMYFNKIKVIDHRTYPPAEKAMESFTFVEV